MKCVFCMSIFHIKSDSFKTCYICQYLAFKKIQNINNKPSARGTAILMLVKEINKSLGSGTDNG